MRARLQEFRLREMCKMNAMKMRYYWLVTAVFDLCIFIVISALFIIMTLILRVCAPACSLRGGGGGCPRGWGRGGLTTGGSGGAGRAGQKTGDCPVACAETGTLCFRSRGGGWGA